MLIRKEPRRNAYVTCPICACNTTLLYTQLVSFESDDYHSATAKTTEEAEQLVEAGFEYVCTTPQDVMLFRKRK